MKKSMLFLGILGFALNASALTFRWSTAVDANYSVGPTGVNLNDTLVYIVSNASNPDPALPLWDNVNKNFGTGWTIYGAGKTANGDVAAVSSSFTGTWGETVMSAVDTSLLPLGSPSTVMSPNNGSANNRDYYLIFLNAGTLATATKYQIVAYQTAGSLGTGSAPAADNTATFALTFTGNTTQGGNWQNIPEPATFALFGVGLAVLGLRRRFMKK